MIIHPSSHKLLDIFNSCISRQFQAIPGTIIEEKKPVLAWKNCRCQRKNSSKGVDMETICWFVWSPPIPPTLPVGSWEIESSQLRRYTLGEVSKNITSGHFSSRRSRYQFGSIRKSLFAVSHSFGSYGEIKNVVIYGSLTHRKPKYTAANCFDLGHTFPSYTMI